MEEVLLFHQQSSCSSSINTNTTTSTYSSRLSDDLDSNSIELSARSSEDVSASSGCDETEGVDRCGEAKAAAASVSHTTDDVFKDVDVGAVLRRQSLPEIYISKPLVVGADSGVDETKQQRLLPAAAENQHHQQDHHHLRRRRHSMHPRKKSMLSQSSMDPLDVKGLSQPVSADVGRRMDAINATFLENVVVVTSTSIVILTTLASWALVYQIHTILDLIESRV